MRNENTSQLLKYSIQGAKDSGSFDCNDKKNDGRRYIYPDSLYFYLVWSDESSHIDYIMSQTRNLEI